MSGTLPAWIERLLGEQPGPGEGTVWTLEHSWAWSPWITLLFVVFAVGFVVAVYLRESRSVGRPYRITLAVIRLAVVAVILMMIAQLALSRQRTGLPYVAVLVDDSLSMSHVDHYDPKQQAKFHQRVRRTGGQDPSGGQGDSDSQGELSRWNLARTLLTEQDAKMLSTIADHHKLRVYFLTGSRPSLESGVAELAEEIRALRPTGESSRLGAGVRAVLDDLRGTAPAAVVLLSDGINTDGPPLADAAELARDRGVPLFTVGLGSDQPVKDLKLSDLLVEKVVFVDDVVNFQFSLTGVGFEGTDLRVVLRRQGKTDELAGVDVTIGPDGQPQQVRLPYRPTEVGRFRYEVEVQPQTGELQTDNNRDHRELDVRKEKIRVLLVQGYPNFEFRYLQKMLQRDETIELNWVLQEVDPESAQQDPAALAVFPVRRDELFSYDVIILGDVNPALLSASMLQNVADFVDQPGSVVGGQAGGGALVLIGGPEYMPSAYRDTPLERLMPIHLDGVRYPDPDLPITEGFVMRPTRLGASSPPMQLGDTASDPREIFSRLPPLYWLLEVSDLKPAAKVLAEHPTRLGHDGRPLPVICLQYVGAGKVLLHATDETWRWRRRVGDVFFARYWIQMIRYLCRSKLVGEGSLDYIPGDPARLRLRFADERLAPPEDDGVTVVLEHQGHRTRRIQLRRSGWGRGVFEGVLTGLHPGSYHAWVAIPAMEGRAPAVDFTIAAPQGEFERLRTDTAAMRRAAEQTKGRFYTFQTAGRLAQDLPPGRQVPIGLLTRDSLWNKWPVLLLFLILLTTEWILRKLGGMV